MLLLRAVIQQQDVTVRLVYESQAVEREGEALPHVRDIVFERATGTVEKTIMLPVAGLYRVDLDNSYSWLNHKLVHFTATVLTPLQLTPRPPVVPHWPEIYYPRLAVTQIAD